MRFAAAPGIFPRHDQDRIQRRKDWILSVSLRRDLAWMAVSQSWFFLIQFIASAILARFISPYDMGIYAVAMAVTGLLSIMQATGLIGFIVREPSLTHNLMASTFTINAMISIIVATLIVFGSVYAGEILHEAGVRRVMFVVAILPIIGMFEFLPAANLEREANFKAIASIGSCRTLIVQASSVGLAISGLSYMSIAYGQVAGALFSAIAYSIVGRRFLNLRPSLVEWRRVTKFGFQMLAISGTNAIGGRMGDLLLGRVISLTALGLYGRAANLNNLIQDNIYMVIVRVLFVDIAQRVRNGESLRESYLTTIEILTAILWPAFAGLAIVSGPFINVVYGARWIGAALPLFMLAIASMVHLTVSLSWQLFVVRHEVTRQTRLECMRTGVGIGVFGIGCLFGLTAAAATRIIEALFTVAIYRPHIGRMTDTRTRDFFPIYQRSGLLTLCAVAPVTIIMAVHGWSLSTSLIQIMAAIICGGVVWFVGILYIDHPLAAEIRRVGQHLGGGITTTEF